MMNNKFLLLVLLFPLLYSCQKYNKPPFDEKEKAIRNFPNTIDVLVLDSLWKKRDSLSYLRLINVRNILIKNSDSIPNWIHHFNRFEILSTDNEERNKIYNLPNSIGKAKSLKQITLSNNKLKNLPSSFFSLSTLSYVNLDSNSIVNISNNIRNLKNLKSLHLSENPLVYIPEEICELPKLEALVLENTKITNLPKCLGNLQNLVWINVSGTHLTEFPIEILSAPKLETIHAKRLKLKNYKEVKAICEKKNITFYYDE